MKHFIVALLSLFALTSCQKKFDELNGRLDSLENRIKALETACAEINSNITALQTIAKALQENNYIKEVTPIIEHGIEIGYTITFTKGDVVTIYHGQDGADGYTPVVGVAIDETDGICYWTLDGEWMLDENGERIPTTGKNGMDGTDGIDGVTPQLKILDGYWHVSYDDGKTWTKLDKSKGEDGDSFFGSVTTDQDNAYFTLTNGSTFAVPLVKNDYISKIQSITYVPRFNDGMAYVINTTRDYSFVEIDFAISPKSATASIVANFQTDARMQIVRTFTKSLDFVDLPISSVTADVNTGIVSVKANCKNLPDSFFNDNETASVSFQVTNGDYTATSAYVPMTIAERITHPSDVTPKIIAHRGYWNTSGSAQNSVTALRKANEIGIWGCELDLWMTSDGVLVLNHDGIINGITIQTSPYSAIKDFTIENGETIPTFEQYLKVFKEECSGLILIIELKPHFSNETTVAAIKEIIRTINRHGVSDLVEYISFSSVACDAIVRYAPTARVAYLESDLTPQQCAERGYTGVDYHYSTYQNNPTWITEAHNLGLDVNTWTLNWFTIVKEMYLAGVDIMTTDQPENVEAWINAL